jgi:hypothetical protein
VSQFHAAHHLNDTITAITTPLPDGGGSVDIEARNLHGPLPMLHWGMAGANGWEAPPMELWPIGTEPVRGNVGQVVALRTRLQPVAPGVARATITVPRHLTGLSLAFVLYTPDFGYQHNAGADFFIPADDVRVLQFGDGCPALQVQHITFTPPVATDFLLPHFPITVAVEYTSPLPEHELADLEAVITLVHEAGARHTVPLQEVRRMGETSILRGTILPPAAGIYQYRIVLRSPAQEFGLARGEIRISEPREQERWTHGPMITQIDAGLFIGNAAAAANPVATEGGHRLLDIHGVTAVLNATPERDPSPALRGSGIEYIQIPFQDFSHNPMDEGKIWEAVRWIDRHITAGEAVLVHCHAGIGRSGSLVVAYLMLCKYPDKGFDEVVALVNARLEHQRHAIYPHVGLPESVARLRGAL